MRFLSKPSVLFWTWSTVFAIDPTYGGHQVWASSVRKEPWGRPTGACDGVFSGKGPTATIDAGIVVGTQTSLPTATASVNKFLGVPFARSPPERFSPPEPTRFTGVINATEFRPACLQEFPYPLAVQQFEEALFNDPGGPKPTESEDCLYLNVYAPSSPGPADGRPVLFWIYGGGFLTGNAGQPLFDGSAFAAYEDIIVVAANYRTNIFGFPPAPELPRDQRNLGFLDQRFALDWVQRNIKAFGGSPNKVTVVGESSGAFSVDALLTSYNASSSDVPFRGAILESSQYSFHPKPVPDTTSSWYNVSTQMGCPGAYSSNLTCLRAANASLIKLAIEKASLDFRPIVDNVTYYSNTAQRRLDGNVAHVPALAGSNAQEERIFQIGQTNITAALLSFVSSNLSYVREIEAAYPLGRDGIESQYDQISQIYTEFVYQCPQALWSRAAAMTGIVNWRYYLNASFYNTQLFPSLGVFHGSEMPLVFGTLIQDNATTQELALSASMMHAWARFVKNPAFGPGWNPVGSGVPRQVLVGATDTTLGGLYTDGIGSVQSGTWDLGLFGNRGNAQSSGVTVIDESEVDFRCGLFKGLYEAANGVELS